MSPFMTGLLLGMTVFSALSLQWAQQELVRVQERQALDARTAAADLAAAMEFAVLTETDTSFDETYALERARKFSNATGETLGGADVLTTVQVAEGEGQFGTRRTQVALTASDDVLLRSQLNRSTNAEQLARLAGDQEPVALFDASGVRTRQALTSQARMEAAAEQVYAYYAANMVFPRDDEFVTIANRMNLKDAWGRDFRYEVANDRQSGVLSFTTPWGHTQQLRVSLDDPFAPVEDSAFAPTTPVTNPDANP